MISKDFFNANISFRGIIAAQRRNHFINSAVLE